jgi:hypothetical protein
MAYAAPCDVLQRHVTGSTGRLPPFRLLPATIAVPNAVVPESVPAAEAPLDLDCVYPDHAKSEEQIHVSTNN